MSLNELVFYAAVCTDVGNSRQNNEDNFCLLGDFLTPEYYFGRRKLRSRVSGEGVIAVFDGMGGESNGELASLLASQCACEFQQALTDLTPEALDSFTAEANRRVCENMRRQGAAMGSTMALAAISGGRCIVGNVGDSRVYLMRGGKIAQLSQDHTVADQLVRMDMLTSEEAARDRRRHQLTQHLGIQEEDMQIQPHVVGPFELRLGDRLLICSDGVTDALSDYDLSALLSQETTCEKMSGGIVDSAMLAGSADNVTAIVAKVGMGRDSSQKGGHVRKKENQGLKRSIWAVSAMLALVLGAIAAILR